MYVHAVICCIFHRANSIIWSSHVKYFVLYFILYYRKSYFYEFSGETLKLSSCAEIGSLAWQIIGIKFLRTFYNTEILY